MKKIRYVVITRRYFDKMYGNSYIAGRVIDLETATWKAIPFQYGYGDAFAMTAGSLALGLERDALTRDNTLVEEVDVSTQKEAKRYQKITEVMSL